MIRLVIFYLVQLLLIIHIIRNQKGFGWIWLLVFLPYVGGLAYLIVEILPGLLHSSRRSAGELSDRVFPGKKLEKAREDFRRSATPYNQLMLARACVETGDSEEAERQYRELTGGWYREDVSVLVEFARCLVSRENFTEARAVLVRADGLDRLTRTGEKALLYFTGLMAGEGAVQGSPLEELFRNTRDLETGYYLCRALKKEEDPDRIRAAVISMKEQVRNNRSLKKSMEIHWIARAEKLLS